jgi:hypothetical protein
VSHVVKEESQYVISTSLCLQCRLQKSAYLVLQLPLTKATRYVIFLPIKSTAELEKLPPNSTDIKMGDIITRYSTRPKQLETWCLADHASRLNIIYPKQNADPFEIHLDDIDHNLEQQHENQTAHDDQISFTTKGGVVYKTRNTPKVIRYIRYNKFTDPEKA